MRATDIPGFDQLTAPEKILLVEDIWEAMSSDEANVPVPRNHITEIRQRLSAHRAAPGELLTLAQLKEALSLRR